MQQLTFGYLTLAEYPQTEIMEVAAAAGFNSVGLRSTKGAPKTRTLIASSVLHRACGRSGARSMSAASLSNIRGRYLEPGTTNDDLHALADTAAELGCGEAFWTSAEVLLSTLKIVEDGYALAGPLQ